MGLFGHMRIHESGIPRNVENTDTPCTPSAPTNLTATTTNDNPQPLPISPARNFSSRIGLVGHLQIHRTEAGEPGPGAPTYNRHARLHCPDCSRTSTHRMGLLGHMHLHDNVKSTRQAVRQCVDGVVAVKAVALVCITLALRDLVFVAFSGQWRCHRRLPQLCGLEVVGTRTTRARTSPGEPRDAQPTAAAAAMSRHVMMVFAA
ncbi:unnamed protein product, partial [Schistocephalus solidus]|uniref:C2H2-type domain-containing protein n=1 Tax=Schistocephalus solidus TaxID=70667 RepID=A0A183SEF0_SCHSO